MRSVSSGPVSSGPISSGPVQKMASDELILFGQRLRLLEDKALYLMDEDALLVSDVHLGKAETFQALGVPIASGINDENLQRLRSLIFQTTPKKLFILGDLFHSEKSLVPEVLAAWDTFLKETNATVSLIVGNHDRRLVSFLPPMQMRCETEAIDAGPFLLSHEPEARHSAELNICGHIHPVVKLRSRTDSLRLPCFFLERDQRRLTLPSFGEFTGGYEVKIENNTCAYVVCEGEIIPFDKSP